MVLKSFRNQTNHLQASLADENVIITPLRGTTSSPISVCMHTLDSINRQKNIPKTLQTLHKQAKIWASYSCKYTPWAFIVLNNGNFPNCEQIQQLRCGICFLYVVSVFFIRKKTKGKEGIIAYNTLFDIGVMKDMLNLHILSFWLPLLKKLFLQTIYLSHKIWLQVPMRTIGLCSQPKNVPK